MRVNPNQTYHRNPFWQACYVFFFLAPDCGCSLWSPASYFRACLILILTFQTSPRSADWASFFVLLFHLVKQYWVSIVRIVDLRLSVLVPRHVASNPACFFFLFALVLDRVQGFFFSVSLQHRRFRKRWRRPRILKFCGDYRRIRREWRPHFYMHKPYKLVVPARLQDLRPSPSIMKSSIAWK